MMGLWLHDYYLFKRQRLAVGLTWGLAVLCLIGFGSWGIEIGMTLFAIMLSMLLLSILSDNQQNHGLKFLLALPVTRTNFVRQKYELLLVNVASAVLIMTGTTWLVAGIQRWQLSLGAIFQQAYLVGLVILALLVVILPYQLKHGPEATQTFMSVVGAVVAAVIGGGYLSVQKTSWGRTIFDHILTAVQQHGLTSLLLVITGLVVILLISSYLMGRQALAQLEL
ncbi:hypothetical protein LFAB_16800 [Lactiplantibacillus fabifermentans T30PCM01]|uniref:Uncharacterized protein n=1 Tax=Lactiplantibacillus fabifermentans T30PCM01 TaxID=1400520 RepID=W6TBG6_9LACO|nr:ABC-2 transporter permease [Lactiplantibacillus fabifermentans]ETY72605.1 hypothetical protein LFAB_16800 [Lactiplantibacillus fabifermentans T30PCM01]